MSPQDLATDVGFNNSEDEDYQDPNCELGSRDEFIDGGCSSSSKAEEDSNT